MNGQKKRGAINYPPVHPEPVEGPAGVACFGGPGVED